MMGDAQAMILIPGRRVQLNDLGIRRLGPKRSARARLGTVVGRARDERFCNVIWDGTKTQQSYSKDFLRPADEIATDAQGIDSPKDGDGLPAPREAQEPGPEGMRPVYTVVPAHQGIINKYLVLKSGLLIVGECWTESDAISLCKLMNEMAGKV